MGFMAGSRVLVRKSQRILGQKMAWREAASWSRGGGLVGGCGRGRGEVQMAAVRMMRRAQWFLMSLPMVRRGWWSWRWDGGEGGC